jgi:hypothetical protein
VGRKKQAILIPLSIRSLIPALLDLEKHWLHLRNSPNLLGAVCTSKPEQQTPSTFHKSNEHNSSNKKTDNTRGLGQLKNFNKRGQLISTMTRTFYEASAAEEEGQRRRRSHGDSTEDGAEPQGEGTRRRLLWMMPRSTSAGPFRRRLCGQSSCCSTIFLWREIKHDPQSAHSWWRRTGQADGDS